MNFQEIYNEAHQEGLNAANNIKPTPMLVTQHANPLDDNSPIVQAWNVPDGVCGFAWINIKPGNSKFANFLKKNNLAKTDGYYGGVSIWVHQFNQSYQKKSAYASAFANILNKHNIKAIPMDRLD